MKGEEIMANEKAVLISIQPQWCAKIASEQKTFEVRKTKPNIPTPFKCYIYCTKGNPKDPHQRLETHAQDGKIHLANGCVFAEFICDFIQPYWFLSEETDIEACEDVQHACLSAEEIINYGNGQQLEFWHISNLVIYDNPKPLSDFCVWKKCNSCKTTGYESSACIYDEDCKVPAVITRPPQSWCYVNEV
jgi:predicted transcriptional regulator